MYWGYDMGENRKDHCTKPHYHEDLDASYVDSDLSYKDQPLSPLKKHSGKKKTINSAQDRPSPAGQKVNIDDDEDHDVSLRK